MNKYTDEQLKFLNYTGNESIILSATAGSGKTHSTVGRLNKMIEEKGKEATISETKKRINVLAKSNPTVTQIEMMYFYRDILNRLNKLQ